MMIYIDPSGRKRKRAKIKRIIRWRKGHFFRPDFFLTISQIMTFLNFYLLSVQNENEASHQGVSRKNNPYSQIQILMKLWAIVVNRGIRPWVVWLAILIEVGSGKKNPPGTGIRE